MGIEPGDYRANFDYQSEKVEAEMVHELEKIEYWNQSFMARGIAEKYRDQLAYDSQIQAWRRYEAEHKGVWTVEYIENVKNIVESELCRLAFKFPNPKTGEPRNVTNGLVSSVESLLRGHLSVRRWDEQDINLLPLRNGVVNLKTRTLSPHMPGNRLTWALPYDYDFMATSKPIIDWLKEMTGDDDIVELIRAYLKAIVTGRADLHRYIELIGPGGTGKSTILRLAQALVGTRNTHTTTLDCLENSKFETASIKDKRLVMITDSDRYGGQVSTLKALTGQDTLHYEVKFQQSREGFISNALVLVAANETIQSSDYTSGLARRRISIPFTNQIPNHKQRNLISFSQDNLSGEFAEFIPGLLNWVLALSDEDMQSYLKDTTRTVPALNDMRMETLLDTNPIADWANRYLVRSPYTKTYVGIKSGNPDGQLYASYTTYASNSGTKAVSLRRFLNLLNDLLNNQLGLNIKKGRDRAGSHFCDIAVRHCSDLDPLFITPHCSTPSESSLSDTTNKDILLENISQVVQSGDGLVTDSVTAESTGTDGCDGCDGKNESSKLGEKSTTADRENFENEKSEDFTVSSILD